MTARPTTRRDQRRRGGRGAGPAPLLSQHPQGQQAEHPHHPQRPRPEDHQHPQGNDGAHPRHPQTEDAPAGAARHVDERADGSAGDAAPPDGRRVGRGRGGCRQADDAVVPTPGSLRPLAQALVAVAAEVHAARRDPLGAERQVGADHLRMPATGVVHPVRWGSVQGSFLPPLLSGAPLGSRRTSVMALHPCQW
jgi:hypothetical protein